MMNRKMNGFFAYVLLAVVLSGCVDKNETFTGYIVAKEYTPEHMSNESEETISYAGFVPVIPHHVTRPPAPRKVDAKWIWFIANRCGVIQKCVSQQMFDTKKCGDKVTVKRWEHYH
jgi:hypothetical protein